MPLSAVTVPRLAELVRRAICAELAGYRSARATVWLRRLAARVPGTSESGTLKHAVWRVALDLVGALDSAREGAETLAYVDRTRRGARIVIADVRAVRERLCSAP
jgi:hypothetical protein